MVIQSLDELKRMLEQEQERLSGLLQHEMTCANDHTGYGTHMADDGTEAFEQAKDLSLRARLEDSLHEVQEALRKFELGTYGVCEACGQPIDWARLEAKPHASLCIKCKQRQDFRR